MRAALYNGNRQIQIGDCPAIPPGPKEVQLKVSHCGICGTDLHLFHGNMDHRVTFPQVIGHESSVPRNRYGPSGNLMPGDIIYAVNKRETPTLEEWNKVLNVVSTALR